MGLNLTASKTIRICSKKPKMHFTAKILEKITFKTDFFDLMFYFIIKKIEFLNFNLMPLWRYTIDDFMFIQNMTKFLFFLLPLHLFDIDVKRV